ncbi:DUF2798 domain-containing protein [Actinotalea sp. M2MS4P-6]|uniref:DUF2798 domain-containing protein n=1 Tax=Actinotalea sp. M2MS4P-6 TaxID=2983762 RepID=UPI0021E36923|nr:DUF2798 domain-containing protein [Actinotalea sp. M2MS4P-6]MCV2394339.1 DUF2798 domain-containing protein [Actinotalea sp. M2MS4P-6]
MRISQRVFDSLFNLIISLIMSFVMTTVITWVNVGPQALFGAHYWQNFGLSVVVSYLVIWATLPLVAKGLGRFFDVTERVATASTADREAAQ